MFYHKIAGKRGQHLPECRLINVNKYYLDKLFTGLQGGKYATVYPQAFVAQGIVACGAGFLGRVEVALPKLGVGFAECSFPFGKLKRRNGITKGRFVVRVGDKRRTVAV